MPILPSKIEQKLEEPNSSEQNIVSLCNDLNFFPVPVNVYFLLVVWYYFQRLGDPLDPMTGADSGSNVADSEAVSGAGVVVTAADLEVLENGKGSSEGPNPFPDNPFA